MSILGDVQRLQFTDKAAAEALLLTFVRQTLELDAQTVELRPLAVSLNSFNGFMNLADGRRVFFKTHTEADNVINEYYHAEALAQVGYRIIQPIYSSTQADRQFLVYEIVTDPSVFDVAWQIEQGQADAQTLDDLTFAQNASDDELVRLYQATLEWQGAQSAAKAPIHQLFFHRVMGGRLDRFYHPEAHIVLPHGTFNMGQVRNVRWVINGRTYWNKIEGIIALARKILHPLQEDASVIGHGDAHNGNVFFNAPTRQLTYFDPAFAGRHSPLLDLVKPLFHNVFAMWMYYPQVKREQLPIQCRVEGDTWHVDYPDSLPSVREMFLRSKVERVLIPIMRELAERGWLRQDWYPYLKTALFCCPFLTMDLTDSAKFPPEISLLGLTMAVQMGTMPYVQDNKGALTFGEGNLIDQVLLHNVAPSVGVQAQ
jgi:hypothetical protein